MRQLRKIDTPESFQTPLDWVGRAQQELQEWEELLGRFRVGEIIEMDDGARYKITESPIIVHGDIMLPGLERVEG